MFAALEARIKAIAERFDGEALHVAEEVRDEALAELAKVKAEAAKIGPLLTEGEAELKTLLAAAVPDVTAITARLEKLLADVEAILGAAPAGM